MRESLAGPWGDLEYTTVMLERPDETFPEPAPPPPQIVWYFGNMPAPQVEGLIANWDLTPDQKKVMLDKTRWQSTTNGWQFLPTIELVRDMRLPARKALYELLEQNPANFFICNPVRIETAKFKEWLGNCGLPADKQALVRQMAIEKDGTMNFYDGQLMEWLCTTAERKSFGKAVTRTPALLMKLRITPQSDLDSLLRYWGQGGRGKAMRPFLESLSKVPGGTSIGVSFLFPTFPRMRLYTYPDPKNDKFAWHEDCFWTGMNFFNETPDYGFFNPDQIYSKLKSEYIEVSTNWTFGDVIMLVDNNRQAIHMCVYVADNVVFTKNGASFLSPWILMKLPEMLKQYERANSLRMSCFRKKTA